LSLERLNGALAFAGRVLPGFRGQATIQNGALKLRASMPVPVLRDLGWWNLEAVVPPFEGRARVASISLGGYALPSGFSLALAEGVANMALGNAIGTRARSGLVRFEVADGGVVGVVDQAVAPVRLLARRFSSVLAGSDLPGLDLVNAREAAIRQAIAERRLTAGTPFSAWLGFTMAEAAQARASGNERQVVTAALFGLARVCGSGALIGFINNFVGRYDGPASGPRAREVCRRVRLGGRGDLRLHFLTSAALSAASIESLSYAVGESKELIDTLAGGSGFDFTDIVANVSGIRFAEVFAAAPLAEWPALVALIESDASVLASRDGIPGRLTRGEFERRFGAPGSAPFTAMLSEIEARVAQLPLSRAGGG
ncbi:MAG: hypothetical protein AAGI34_19330, partial [Pseudomonadota bacterium]